MSVRFGAMVSLLDHSVLVVDVGRDGPLLNGFNQPVGSVQTGWRRKLELRELDGTLALTVGEAVRRPRGSRPRHAHPVTPGTGQPIGFATQSIGYSWDDEAVLFSSGGPHALMESELRRSPTRTELARIERLGRAPRHSSTFFTRFCSDRFRFEFITEAADLRSLAIAVAFIAHRSRNDE